jgi:hypothetical protein
LAATNRWLTAADACVARSPTKLAFCSRFRRQRKMSLGAAEGQFSLASSFGLAGLHRRSLELRYDAAKDGAKRSPHKAQKGRR